MKTHSVTTNGIRLDIYLIDLISPLTRSKIQSLIKNQRILVNNSPAKPSYILKGTEIISYMLDETDDDLSKNIISEDINLKIIYEDSDILVVDKEPGMVVHPGAGNYSGTLLNAVIDKIDQNNFGSTPGIVHRLDKETSGIIIIAKNFISHSFISKQFERRTVKKTYKALIWGKSPDKGVVKGNIIRSSKDRKSFILTDSEKGRYSKTEYEIIEYIAPISYIRLNPLTGRTHQIRVHMKSIGHPIISDEIYSGGNKMIKSFHVKYSKILKKVLKTVNRVALHAESIEIIHPSTNKKVKFNVEVPNDIKNAIKVIKDNESI